MLRFILIALVAFSSVPAGGQEAAAPSRKLIFAVGGWKTPKDGLPLMRYFVSLTGKPNPKVCLLPTASGDSAESIVSWYDIMNQLECRPRHLRLFHPSRVESFEAVRANRKLQEDKLMAANPGGAAIMDDTALDRFLMHYERLTLWMLEEMPARSDGVLKIGPDQRPL